MLKSFKTLKRYYKLANVKKYLLIFEFITFLIPSILSIVSPVLTAEAITAITVFDFSKAILMISLDFAIIALTSILYFIYHFISNKTTKIIVNNLEEYVFENVSQNKNLTKIHSSTLNSIWQCAEFNRDFLFKICFLIKSIILLGIIIYFNLLLGIVILVVSLITFLLLRLCNIKIQQNDSELDVYKRDSLELFNNIQQGSKIETNLSLEKSLKDKYFKYVNNSVKINNKISLFYSLNNNFISLILKSAVFGLTIYLITLIKTTTLTLSLYLILTPYLTSSAENLIEFFDLIPQIGLIDNSLKEFEALKFQEVLNEPTQINLTSYDICFSNVSLSSSATANIKNVNLIIPHGSLVLFYGKENCGKRAIFLLLSKKEKPSYGSILVDNKNIYDIVDSSYNMLFSFTTKEPYFYKMSIFENLYLVSENKTKINRTIKQFGLKPEIDKLKDGLNTTLDETISASLKFLLGITRAYLSGAGIICIYELPSNLNKTYSSIFSKMIQIINHNKTILIFSHDKDINLKFDFKYFIENSEIKSQISAKSSKKPK